MRSKTFVLGMLVSLLGAFVASIFISATGVSSDMGEGYNPGERLPSIKVDDIELQEVGGEEPTLVVLWSKRDAKSRVVNSWLCRTADVSKVVSVCVDADSDEARQYASIDGVSDDVLVRGTNQGQELKEALGMKKSLKSLYLQDGVVQSVTTASETWEQLMADTECELSEK